MRGEGSVKGWCVFEVRLKERCLSHCSIAVRRHHGQGNSYNGKPLTGGLPKFLTYFIIIMVGSREACTGTGAVTGSSEEIPRLGNRHWVWHGLLKPQVPPFCQSFLNSAIPYSCPMGTFFFCFYHKPPQTPIHSMITCIPFSTYNRRHRLGFWTERSLVW